MQLQVDGASPWATLRKAPPASMVKRASVKLGAFSDKGMPGLGAPTESDQAFEPKTGVIMKSFEVMNIATAATLIATIGYQTMSCFHPEPRRIKIAF